MTVGLLPTADTLSARDTHLGPWIILMPVGGGVIVSLMAKYGSPKIKGHGRGGAVGSLIGQILHTTAAERKVLFACGAAAGMSATFSTPIAGVILAIELLLLEFKSRSFIPLVIASTLAAAVHMQLLGPRPHVPGCTYGFRNSQSSSLLRGSGCDLRNRRVCIQQGPVLGCRPVRETSSR